MTADRSIPRETIARMIRTSNPEWELEDAVPAERGHTAVYHTEIDMDGGVRRCVLKASPDDLAHGIVAESRLLALLDDRTSIPVPAVIAVVDDHDDLPTPFFLMEAMPGTALPYRETGLVSDRVLRRIARQTGEYLGELHSVDAVASFGAVSYDRSARLVGGQPAVGVDRFGVENGFDSWSAFLSASVDPELDTLETSRFADLAPRIRSGIRDRIQSLTGSFAPVLGRIDHGVHNLLVRPEDGDIEAVIDWGFTLAVTPGYDLQTVEWVLSGAVLSPLPDASDRRALVRDAMADGYRETAPYPSGEMAEHGTLYELMAVLRALNHLDEGVAKVPEGSEETVATGLRTDVERILE